MGFRRSQSTLYLQASTGKHEERQGGEGREDTGALLFPSGTNQSLSKTSSQVQKLQLALCTLFYRTPGKGIIVRALQPPVWPRSWLGTPMGPPVTFTRSRLLTALPGRERGCALCSEERGTRFLPANCTRNMARCWSRGSASPPAAPSLLAGLKAGAQG